MSCLPYCNKCGRHIDCSDAGLCDLCRDESIKEYKKKYGAKDAEKTSKG